MNDLDAQRITRENDYLKLRCAQLQSDVTDLNSEVGRLQQALERFHGARGDHRAAALLNER